MGSELPDNEQQKPDNEQQQREQESTLIFGSGQNQTNPAPGKPLGDDLTSPVQPGSASRPELSTPIERPAELERLKHELEVSTAKLRQEQEQRLRLETRQMELIERMELLLAKAEKQGISPAAANGRSFRLPTLLPSLAAGILGGGLVLAMLPWLGGQKHGAQSPGLPNPAQTAASPEPGQAQETVRLSCVQPCWLDIRAVDSGKRVYYSLLKGTSNLPLGSGLDIFSGRADLVKVRINNGPERPLLTGRVVGSRVILPAKPAEPTR